MNVWTSCLIALCALVQTPIEVPREIAKERFPLPQDALTLTWSEPQGPSMVELLNAFTHATGCPVFYSSETRYRVLRLDELDLPGATNRLVVSPEAVYFEFESLLRAHNFMLVHLFDRERGSAVRVLSLDTMELNTAKRHAFFEPIETIEAYRRHPAVLVTTYLPLSSATDTRMVAMEMRRSLTNANIHQVIPAGGGLILTGFGSLLCQRIDFLREVDARNAAGDTVDQETMEALRQERFPPPTEASEESK
jgi:hypothetical protein